MKAEALLVQPEWLSQPQLKKHLQKCMEIVFSMCVQGHCHEQQHN